MAALLPFDHCHWVTPILVALAALGRESFFYETKPMPLPNFDSNRPHATKETRLSLLSLEN